MSARPKIHRRSSSEPTPSEEGGGLYFSSPKKNYQFVPTGCALLDCVLGGGWALGHVANIVGDKSTGKTLLAIEAIANLFLQYSDSWCHYVQAEGAAFDSDYAKALGIPMDRVVLKDEVDTVEELFDDLNALRYKEPGLYIVDSLDALSDEAEMGRGIREGTYGAAKPKLLGQLFRRTVRKLGKQATGVIIVSQVRDNIGVSFGEKHTRSGGKALDFYASQILWLAKIKTLDRTIHQIKRPTGVIIRANCKKNKIGLPFRHCDFNIRFGYGIEDTVASADFLTSIGKTPPKTPEALREAVIREWYAVEKRFLPEKRKYA